MNNKKRGNLVSYPNYFPKGCPPKDAKNIEMLAYRICKNNVISHDDFLSHYELGLFPSFGGDIKYGVSLISDKEKAINMLRLPRFSKSYVAEGITKKGLGVVKNTPSKQHGNAHYTWWLKNNTQPEIYFSII